MGRLTHLMAINYTQNRRTPDYFDGVEAAIKAIAAGELVIVTDDESRENEGDLVMAAARVTPEAINHMLLYGRGLICVPTTDHQLRHLGLRSMVGYNRDIHGTDFTVSVDAAEGITTGISAYDRASTVKILADPQANPEQLIEPGHVFPLRARPGGVLERAGHTEAAVDLASLAGLHPSGVICEILNQDGACARLPELVNLKKRFGLKMISIADLITYRYQSGRFVEHLGQRPFSFSQATFQLHLFRNKLDDRRHLALCLGELDAEPTLVRVHSENILSDVFGERGDPESHTLEAALAAITRAGRGVLVYLKQSHGGIDWPGLTPDQEPSSTTPIDLRTYGIGAQILVELGLHRIELLTSSTSSKRKVIALDGYGLEIVRQRPLSSAIL